MRKANYKNLSSIENNSTGNSQNWEGVQSERRSEQIRGGYVPVSEILNYLVSDRYIGKSEAACYLGISLRTLQSQLRQIPHYRLGGRILFKRSELDSWMQHYRESTDSLDEMIEDSASGVVPGWKGSRPSVRRAQEDQGKFSREQFERAKPFLSEALRKRLETQFMPVRP